MPRVSPLHSQVAFLSQPGGVVFNIADARKFFTRPAQPSCPSRYERSFCPAFRRLSLGESPLLLRDRQSPPPVLMHSSNPYPQGNCDSSRLETCPDYLTRSGTVSHRPSPPSSFFRVTGARERARGTGESCLAGTCAPVSEEPCQPAWPGFSPVTRDYPGTFNGNLSTAADRSVLSMNCEQSSRFLLSF